MVVSPIDYDVPEHFKQHGIKRIYQTGPIIKTVYNNTAFVTNFDINKVKTFGKNFREAAGKVITSNGTNASELIEQLAMHVLNQASTLYEKGIIQTTGSSSNSSSSRAVQTARTIKNTQQS